MAATLGTLPVKILAQVGDGEPIEIGTYDIPISIGGVAPASHIHGGAGSNCREASGASKPGAGTARLGGTLPEGVVINTSGINAAAVDPAIVAESIRRTAARRGVYL